MRRKSLEATMYHSVLRIAVCVFALVLVFDSGLVSERTELLSRGAQEYVASAVGVKVGVAPNEVNVLTARITELENELAAKDRNIAVSINRGEAEPKSTFDTSTFILSIILFILLVLIVMNYILDYLRSRPGRKRTVMVS
jgi:hypothetical protein